MDLSIDEFTLQEDEVIQVKWFSSSEIKESFLKQPETFIPSFKNIISLFLS
jgi:isopentenyldiphosphate isomerase